MAEFIVEADGYSIEFNGMNGLRYQNIRLNPLIDHYEIIRRAKRERNIIRPVRLRFISMIPWISKML